MFNDPPRRARSARVALKRRQNFVCGFFWVIRLVFDPLAVSSSARRHVRTRPVIFKYVPALRNVELRLFIRDS